MIHRARWTRLFRGTCSALRKQSQAIFERLLDRCLPPRCGACERSLEFRRPLCEGCEDALVWIGSACLSCGMPVVNPGPSCQECRGRRFDFDRVFACGVHDGVLRKLVLRHKYASDVAAREVLVSLLESVWHSRLRPFLQERNGTARITLVPITAHPLKTFLRGRDPVSDLARPFSRRSGQEIRGLLVRTRWTRPQTGLPRKARLRNPIGSFRVRAAGVLPERVLLIDDVVTSGSTVSEAARVLRARGVKEIYVLAAGRASQITALGS